MFKRDNGYFEQIECPNIRQFKTCDIVNCIYLHPDETKSHKRSLQDVEGNEERSESDDSDVKRQVTLLKKSSSSTEVNQKEVSTILSDNGAQTDNMLVATNDKPKQSIKIENTTSNLDDTEKDIPIILPKPALHLKLIRAERIENIKQLKGLSPRSSTPNKDAIAKELELANEAQSIEQYEALVNRVLNKEELKDPEFIMPTHIPVPPATIQVRKQNIVEMVKVIKQMQPHLTTPKLKAIEEEYQIAKATSKHTYQQSIRKKVYEFKNPTKFQTKKKSLSDEDMYEALSALIISHDTLVKFGFIMEVPEPVEPKELRVCRRCGHEFKMKDQLLPIHCEYHPGKVSMRKNRKRAYDCCGAEVGDNETEGCASYPHHVFYWDGPGEMQAFLPFQRTSEIYKPNPNAFKALGVDCEMGFTTKGFELLRVTAMDFFTGEEVLDVLVKPIGEVVDFNSRWSGISEIKEDALTFEESTKLFGEIMDENTILIGHGLENDVNAMRLIHNRIVDTAILYPKFKTSPRYRYPLKYLTFKYLNKKIQTGEHDSGEDALAAIDIVKYFIKQDALAD